jgi:hypothetical protein
MTRYLLLFDSYGLILCGAPSLTRGRVCLLYMLLALVSAVFLGSESQGTLPPRKGPQNLLPRAGVGAVKTRESLRQCRILKSDFSAVHPVS